MEILTNSEILTLVKGSTNYSNFTSQLTDEIFTAAGFEELEQNDYRLLEDFFNLSVRVVLNKIRTADPHIPDAYRDVVEEYATEKGGITQRINIQPIKPLNPKYRNLQDGDSVDPFIVRKPKTDERFYRLNFDYANSITIQDINLQQIFLNETGLFTYVEGITRSFNDSYYIQKFLMFKNMINLAINSTNAPLQDTQKITNKEISVDDVKTQEEFIRSLHNLADTMRATVMTKNFNAKRFEHSARPETYTLLVRANKWNIIKTGILATTYHLENLGIPFKIDVVDNFGGLYYTDLNDNRLKEVYDERTGEQIGYNTNGSSSEELVPTNELKEVDPNENILAVLAQRGVIFATTQNPYTIRSIYNPRGMYINHFANQPNGSFNYDATYDLFTFTEIPQNKKVNNK